jgi:hypothetical protein
MQLLRSLSALLLITVVIGLSAGCRKNAGTQQQPVTSGQAAPVESPAHHPDGGNATPVAQTKFFKGSIGSALGLHMKLVRQGDSLSGNYFYQKVGTRIDLKGTIDSQGNVSLEEFDPSGKQTGVFKGLWKSDAENLISIVGNWSKPNDNKQTAFSVHEEPISFSGATEIHGKTIKENNKKLKYEISAEYPEIVGALDTRFDRFNQEARTLVAGKVAEFRKDIAERSADETIESASPGSDFGVGYTVALANDDLVSVEFDIGGYYAGAAHPNSYTGVINYDARNGKILRLSDLFKPGARYLPAISTYAIKDLNSQGKAKGADSMLDDEMIQSGAGPDAKNFKSWTITRKGLALTFDAYQVAPYAAGPQHVLIPYSALKHLIKPDGPLAGIVGAAQ